MSEIAPSIPFLSGRGELFCRGCLGEVLFSGLDLGALPIANELLLNQESKIDKFPLHLRICSACGLGQVSDVVTPERIFRDYRYLSSMSSTFLQHASTFVEKRVQEGMFSHGDWVLEIASNDGYLLKNFLPYGIKALGVEPAENVAAISRSIGIETISDFFSCQLANELLSKYGYPKLIIANNVMAHVPDLIDFVKGLSLLCGPLTKISIENPPLMNILNGMQFDTIYHEHYSYLSAFTISKIVERYGMQLLKVDNFYIHGGSNRYWLESSKRSNVETASVARAKQFEQDYGVFDFKQWLDYGSKVSTILENLRKWLQLGKDNGRRIYGYGAAAKASTLLNSIEIDASLLVAIADKSLEKQLRFMPPNGIPIISPEDLFSKTPSDILIFPWNLKIEIVKYLRPNLDAGVRFWCAIPEMHEVLVS